MGFDSLSSAELVCVHSVEELGIVGQLRFFRQHRLRVMKVDIHLLFGL